MNRDTGVCGACLLSVVMQDILDEYMYCTRVIHNQILLRLPSYNVGSTEQSKLHLIDLYLSLETRNVAIIMISLK